MGVQGAQHGPPRCQLGCHDAALALAYLLATRWGSPRSAVTGLPRVAERARRSASASSADRAPSERPLKTAFAYTRVPERACRLLMTRPSSSASSSASAKLWFPPVSSNGLNRTRPTRWIVRRFAASRTADRADSSSSSRATARTLSRWASRTASRLRPSTPRVRPSSRRRRRPVWRARNRTRTRRTRTATASPTIAAPTRGATAAFRSIWWALPEAPIHEDEAGRV